MGECPRSGYLNLPDYVMRRDIRADPSRTWMLQAIPGRRLRVSSTIDELCCLMVTLPPYCI